MNHDQVAAAMKNGVVSLRVVKFTNHTSTKVFNFYKVQAFSNAELGLDARATSVRASNRLKLGLRLAVGRW